MALSSELCTSYSSIPMWRWPPGGAALLPALWCIVGMCVYVCADVCIPASLSVATSVPLFFPGTPGRSSGLKSLSVLQSKSGQKSLPINFFL